MTSIFVVDDHPVVSMGLALAVRGTPAFSIVGEVAEPKAGLREVARLAPDALIMDLVFGGVLRLSWIARFRALAPAMAILVYTSLPARHFAADTAAAGADGFLSKEADLTELLALIASLAAVPNRRGPAAPTASVDGPRKLLGALPRRSLFRDLHLTSRELAVARLLARGLSVATIALELDIGAKTAAAHRDNIRRKLDCRASHELVARLARLLVEDQTQT